MSTPPAERWDVFCRVVDNFGDVGVSWRLARQLAREHGKRVRLVGYMVQQEQPGAGVFVLSPLPLTLGDADEGLADEMPPTALLVQLPESARFSPAHMPGLIQITGRLQVGRVESAAIPGRVFPARLELDPRLARILAKANK